MLSFNSPVESLTISQEFAQVHVRCISNAIQPSHPLKPSSPSAFSLSQQQETVYRFLIQLLPSNGLTLKLDSLSPCHENGT